MDILDIVLKYIFIFFILFMSGFMREGLVSKKPKSEACSYTPLKMISSLGLRVSAFGNAVSY